MSIFRVYTFIGLQPQIWHSGTAERHGKTFGRGLFKNGSAKRLKNKKKRFGVKSVGVQVGIFFWIIWRYRTPFFVVLSHRTGAQSGLRQLAGVFFEFWRSENTSGLRKVDGEIFPMKQQ